MRRARELMPARVVLVGADEPLATCAALFRGYDIRHLPVVDAVGGLLGVVRQEDVAARGEALPGGGWMASTPDQPRARGLATAMPLVFDPDDAVGEVVRRMLDAKADCAVGVRDGLVVGLITEHDAVWAAQWAIDEALRAGDAASTPLVSLPSAARATEARVLMRALGVRHLAVVDGEVLVGVVSERDLVVCAADPRAGLGAIARSPALTVRHDEPLAAAAERMAEHKVGCLPVVDEAGRAFGMLTRWDLARFVSA
jgi:CBS domain-containing protein